MQIGAPLQLTDHRVALFRIKVRQQLEATGGRSTNFARLAINMVKAEGFLSIYKGVLYQYQAIMEKLTGAKVSRRL